MFPGPWLTLDKSLFQDSCYWPTGSGYPTAGCCHSTSCWGSWISNTTARCYTHAYSTTDSDNRTTTDVHCTNSNDNEVELGPYPTASCNQLVFTLYTIRICILKSIFQYCHVIATFIQYCHLSKMCYLE